MAAWNILQRMLLCYLCLFLGLDLSVGLNSYVADAKNGSEKRREKK